MSESEDVTSGQVESAGANARQSAEAEAQIRRMSRRSFLWAGTALIGGYSGWSWLTSRRSDSEVPWPLRRSLELDEQLNRDYFAPSRQTATYAQSVAAEPKVNGDIGLTDEIDLDAWALRVEGVASGEPLHLKMDAIRRLPKVEIVTELRCIEGWSVVVHWAGARLSDFVAMYPPTTRSGNPANVREHPEDLPEYMALSTPDGAYYVGLDTPAALHPQTLLCYEMNGQPLTADHGAPLRLVIPVKYGIKNLKRIGTIRYTQQRPPDYWAEQGYDWYAGL